KLPRRWWGSLHFIQHGEIRKGHMLRERNMPVACFVVRVRAGAVPTPGESLHLRHKRQIILIEIACLFILMFNYVLYSHG
ncbi:MAG: hypothetical protein IJK35_02365, partial [Oscillospiraceae bacterium]|nr:hypothetical protein [Oscillospiraceae bacterium]